MEGNEEIPDGSEVAEGPETPESREISEDREDTEIPDQSEKEESVSKGRDDLKTEHVAMAEGVEVLGEEDGEGEGIGEEEDYLEGALLGDKDYMSSSETDSDDIVEGEEVEGEELEEEEKGRRRKRKPRLLQIITEEEEEAMGELWGEDGVLEEEAAHAAVQQEERTQATRARRASRMSKDFKVHNVISDFDLDMVEDDGEEESTETEESEPTLLEREPYYEKYLRCMKNYAARRRMNNFLHKKMAEYFKKRKMEHVIREMAERLEEATQKYGKKLDNFETLIELDKSQRATVNAELLIMKQMRERQSAIALNTFNSFIALERETGIGLINSKTGKEIPDKAVDKLLNQQKNKAKEIQNLRLMHFKIRNAVADKHASIRALDKIGENYTLIEFEQMKIENQAHLDKVEERDDELTKLRRKCSATTQCLAHIREKCSAVELNIVSMKVKLEDKDMERAEAREEMNDLQQKRDYYRRETNILKNDNGLMTKDKLLIDMEDSIAECKALEEKIGRRAAIFAKRKERLVILKENFENEKRKKGVLDVSKRSRSMSLTTGAMRVFKKRPTIMIPIFEYFKD